MRCPSCDAIVDAEAWFCAACGHPLATPEQIAATDDPAPSDDPATATATVAPDAAPLVEHPVDLEVVDGPDVGLRVRFEHGLGRVGTDAGCGLRLTDPAVSRTHLEVRARLDGLEVEDVGSKNGVYLDGLRVAAGRLPPHGLVRLGPRTVLRIVRAQADAAPPGPLPPAFDRFVTHDAALRKRLDLLARVARQTGTVLLQGETGTGKEILARAVHDASPRAAAPYVVVDCGAAAPSLLESQLFGHRKGAFTSAHEDQVGAFEHARGGTVFLDEIGELPLDLQPKLLRVLESRTVRRLGEVEERPVDVRFVAATHRDLSAMMTEGGFRADLYYRLAVFRLEVPPLRARPEDVPALAARLVRQLTQGTRVLAPEAFAVLSHYDWPGNARELRNVLERAVAVTNGPRIGPEDLFEDPPARPRSFADAKSEVVSAFERRYASALLDRHQGNVSAAAKEAGLSRPALYALLKRTGAASSS